MLLQYKYHPGQTLYYTVDNGSHIVVQYDVNQHEVTHSSASVKHFRVVDVYDNGSAVLRLMIDRAYMRANQLGDVVVFDSVVLVVLVVLVLPGLPAWRDTARLGEMPSTSVRAATAPTALAGSIADSARTER